MSLQRSHGVFNEQKATLVKASKSRSPIKLIVFDLGGTVIIPYCYIPEMAFDITLKKYGITLAPEVIRGPMGKKKSDHLKELAALPKFQQQWTAKYKKLPIPSDIDSVYKAYEAVQDELLKEQAKYIPHAEAALRGLKLEGISAVATTGFHANTTKKLSAKLKLNDHFQMIVSADQVFDSSRSGMIRKAMHEHGISERDADKVVFVTDSKNDVLDVKKKLPGMHVIGTAGFGTHMEVSNDNEANALTKETWIAKTKKAQAILQEAGADKVIGSLYELPAALKQYEQALEADRIVDQRFMARL